MLFAKCKMQYAKYNMQKAKAKRKLKIEGWTIICCSFQCSSTDEHNNPSMQLGGEGFMVAPGNRKR